MKKFNYEKAFKKASKGYTVWDAKQQKYVVDPSKFSFRLKFFKKAGVFKNSTGRCLFNPSTGSAISYDWWTFVRVIKGKYVFNRQAYSNTTSKHQSAIFSIVRDLNIKPWLTVHTKLSLDKLDAILTEYYEAVYQLEVEEKRQNAKSRTASINQCKKVIRKLRELGAKPNQQLSVIKTNVLNTENERIARLSERAAQRKQLRDRVNAIRKADPKQLSSKSMLTETNAEIRKMLIQKIGAARVLKDLNAKVLDKAGDYELVNLDLGDNRTRPYLRMLNPSTGEVHVEGVDPSVETVNDALAWRNQQPRIGEFIKPIKLT